MSLLEFFVPTAMAADTAAAAPAGPGSGMPIVLLFVIVIMMYFMIWRPQNKMKKDHQKLVTDLAVGDEIVTGGGVVGKIKKLEGGFVHLTIAKDVTIHVQKAAVSNALPKGSVTFD